MPKRGPGRCSTVICNHVGFFETLTLITSPLCTGFIAKTAVGKMPLVGSATDGLQSIYIRRDSSKNTREQIIQDIIDRQERVEVQNQNFFPLCIFAEGTATNGECLLPFHRGAFAGMRTV